MESLSPGEENKIKDIRNLFTLKKEQNYTAVKDYIECKRYGDKNRTLSVEKYLNKIRPYLKGIINNFKNLTHGKLN